VTKKTEVANAMRQLIAEGHWQIGESVGDLGKLEAESETLFGIRVSWGTIRSAEEDLVNEGLLSVIQPGVPTRVIALPTQKAETPKLAELRALHAKLGEVYSELSHLLAKASG
jgi:DNA-binding FadR family transcriptional regulator